MIAADRRSGLRRAGFAHLTAGGGQSPLRRVGSAHLTARGGQSPPYSVCIALLIAAGCHHEFEPPVQRVSAQSALPYGMTIAVAPAMNHSGSSALDPLRVGDLMASELGTVN